MEASVAIDGELIDPTKATISVFDRGFLYGDSIFDTTRTYGGVLFKLKEHVERLSRSADKMGFALPLTIADMIGEVTSLVGRVRARDPQKELIARLMVTRGEGPFGLDPEGASNPRRILFITPLKMPAPEAYRSGIDVTTYATFRPSDAAMGAKVGNYLESVLAIRAARGHGAHEAIILSHDGHVVEGTTTNIFAIHGDELLTPPTTETLLPGITRAGVIEVAASVGLKVVERRMTPIDVASADEAFITSSIRELLPVARIDGHPIASSSGPKTRALHEAFRAANKLAGPAPWVG